MTSVADAVAESLRKGGSGTPYEAVETGAAMFHLLQGGLVAALYPLDGAASPRAIWRNR
jgi:hypothetical protein